MRVSTLFSYCFRLTSARAQSRAHGPDHAPLNQRKKKRTKITFVYVNLRTYLYHKCNLKTRGNTEIFSEAPSSAPGSLEVKEKGISDDLLRSFYAVFRFPRESIAMGAAVSSTLRELGSEEVKKEQRQTPEAIGLDFRSPPASTPDTKADDCTGDCT